MEALRHVSARVEDLVGAARKTRVLQKRGNNP